jgi:hypothetical protein
VSRKGDTRRGSEQGRLMAQYAVQPLGGGTYGVYDRNAQRFVRTFSGRGAMQKANRKWRALVGVS